MVFLNSTQCIRMSTCEYDDDLRDRNIMLLSKLPQNVYDFYYHQRTSPQNVVGTGFGRIE